MLLDAVSSDRSSRSVTASQILRALSQNQHQLTSKRSPKNQINNLRDMPLKLN